MIEVSLAELLDSELMKQQPRNRGKFEKKGAEPLGKRISVRLHQSVEEKLIEISSQKGVSPAELIRRLVTDLLLGKGSYLKLMGKEDGQESSNRNDLEA